MKIHKTLEPSHWFQYSLFEQLANVGTDIERVIRWRKKGNLEYSENAFARALELLDLTIADPKNRNAGLKELVVTREELVDYFVYDNQYNSNDQMWQDYFYQFNYAAAIQNGK